MDKFNIQINQVKIFPPNPKYLLENINDDIIITINNDSNFNKEEIINLQIFSS